MTTNTIFRPLGFKTSSKLLTCSGLVAVSDFLFYGHPAEWTQGLFALLLLLSVLGHNEWMLRHRQGDVLSYLVLGLTLAMMEAPNALTIWMYALTLLALVVLPKMTGCPTVKTALETIGTYALTGWRRLYGDGLMIWHARKRQQKRHGHKRALLRHWLLPIGLSAVFVMLFAQANPIITRWLDAVHWDGMTDYFALSRQLYWLIAACGCWSVIRPKLKQQWHDKKDNQAVKRPFTLTALLFNERSILISLVLFNGLFLMQNLLDVAFLWSGAALPEGMTYAQYAHQGAYPLIITALLAVAFVLIALKPGSATERQPAIRPLVYAWVGQNVFLVLSSITRLEGYISEYSLTWLRVTAFIWMGLVALGLLLIVARIHLGKSNEWLIRANALALFATLYVCCFINFGGIIAEYNVSHCREVTGTGANLDTYYLEREIGVEAIPALKEYDRHYSQVNLIHQTRYELEMRLRADMQDWRQWTFRKFRLARMLRGNDQRQDDEPK